MRVLQLVTRRQRRGAEVFAAELADSLVDRGHDALVLGLYPPPEPPLTPVRAGAADLGARPGGGLRPGAARALARTVAAFEPDVVQANGSDTLKYAVAARALGRGRWPLVYRNISVASRWLRGPLHRAFNRALAHRADHVVAVSAASAEDFLATYGVDGARLSVIPQSAAVPETVDAAGARAQLEAAVGVPLAGPVLIHVGSVSPEKNHALLLDAFADLAGRPDAPHLVLVGDGPLLGDVRARIAALGLTARVHVLGARPDAADLMAGVDLLLLPSLVEGLPGVVLEAGARAVPAVASDVGGVAEAVVDGETGALVPPGDRAALVAAVSTLLDDPERRRTFGAAARRRVAERFSLAAAVGRYEALYRSLI